MHLNGLIPARFLTLIAYFILTVILYWSKTPNIEACLPLSYTQSQFDYINTQIIIGVSISLGFFAFEIVGFMAAISMFMPSQGMISFLAHASGSVSLVLFLFDTWCAFYYWYIFAFCSCVPFVTEILVWIGVFVQKKSIWTILFS